MLNTRQRCVFWIRATMAAASLVATSAIAGEQREEKVRDELEDGEWVQFTGVITRIGHESLTLHVGRQDFEVDTSALAYDRFDASSARPVEVGDRVIVFGKMDDRDLLGDRQIEASTMTKLPDGSEDV